MLAEFMFACYLYVACDESCRGLRYPHGCTDLVNEDLLLVCSINVLIDWTVYLLATETGADDTSAGADVAAAWCE